MFRRGLIYSSALRRLGLTPNRTNVEFQGKLDSEIKNAVKSGLNKPSAIYEHLAASKIIFPDDHQREVVAQLDKLNDRLESFEPVPQEGKTATGFFGFFSGGETPAEVVDAKIPGAYLFGNVGTGKTMLMDLFYTTTPVVKKRRVHFNRFMLDIHERIHKLRFAQMEAQQIWDRIADDLIEDVHLLCFDEFQVTDIADAMNMKNLFSALFKRGLVVIATSNRHPDNLYEYGLQRQNFMPFIPMLKRQVELINLDSGKDYRKSEVFGVEHPSWLEKTDGNLQHHIDKIYRFFGNGEVEIYDKNLIVLGHDLNVPKSTGAVAEFTFDELCQDALAAQDYLALAGEFSAVIVRDVPRIDLYTMNSALRRFIIMIDQFYDKKVAVLLILDDHLDNLYFSSHSGDSELTQTERIFMDDHQVQGVAEGVKIATLSGSEEAFAIERKMSRLAEMSSEIYWRETEKEFLSKTNKK